MNLQPSPLTSEAYMNRLHNSFTPKTLVWAAALFTAGAACAGTELVRSGPKSSGAGSNFSEEYILIAKAPEGKKIVSDQFTLIGDRTQCGAWARCRLISRTDTMVVWAFSLQGHSEGGPLLIGNPNSGMRDSEGLITYEVK